MLPQCKRDLTTSRLTRISEELFGSYQPESKTVFEDSQRLRTPTEYSAETELKLRRSDMDFNGHVHNTRYIDLALEDLPNEIFPNDDFSKFHVLYYKPVLEDSVVKAQYHTGGLSHLVSIYADSVCCSLVKFK